MGAGFPGSRNGSGHARHLLYAWSSSAKKLVLVMPKTGVDRTEFLHCPFAKSIIEWFSRLLQQPSKSVLSNEGSYRRAVVNHIPVLQAL